MAIIKAMGKENKNTSASVIGANIKRLRLQKGWSQAELAKRAGINPKTVYRHENGETRPDEHSLWSTAEALEVGVDELLREEKTNDFYTLSWEIWMKNTRICYENTMKEIMEVMDFVPKK